MQALKLSCDVASGGNEAIQMMKYALDKPYNIFFIDWQMPDMDGIELAKRIKEIDRNNSIVIMVSETNWNTIEKEALAAGVNCFMPKPLFPSTLVNTINNCAGRDQTKIDSRGQEKETQKNYNFCNHTILIAEDVEINREIMSAILEETQVSIEYAFNGMTAVSMFSEQPEKYSLILMDINMPEMDGYNATKTIRSLDLKKAKDIPIIAMTANVFKEDIDKCIASGMNDHTGKPVDSDALFRMLDKYLSSPIDKVKNGSQLDHGVIWDDSLLLGNILVDIQHQKLFELATDLAAACRKGNSTEKLQETLEFLANYAIKHFTDEEALQIEYSYPNYERHKQIHNDFKTTIDDLVERFKSSGSSLELNSDINEIIVRWLVNHIKNEDKKISDYIRSIDVTGDKKK